MDFITKVVIGLVMGVIAIIFGTASITTTLKAKRSNEDWQAVAFFWGCVLVVLLLLFLSGYDAVNDSI